MQPNETMEYRGYRINIYQDEDEAVENPIQGWDMLGQWVCWHRRYSLSTTKEFDGWEPSDFVQWADKHGHLLFPLYMYDHSGLAFSLGRDYPFDDPWDSGQVGYVLVRKEQAIAEYGKKLLTTRVRQRVLACVESELKAMNQYHSGDVWGYEIEAINGPDMQDNSCWGFFGLDFCIKEAKRAVDWQVRENHKRHMEQAKTFIRNRVPLYARVFIY